MSSRNLSVITKTYDFVLWMLPKISKFPRDRRFVLGERMENRLFDLLENLIEAKYTRDPKELLKRANMGLEIFRFSLRLAKDMKIMNLDSYEFASSQIHAIGSEIGGWLKSERTA